MAHAEPHTVKLAYNGIVTMFTRYHYWILSWSTWI